MHSLSRQFSLYSLLLVALLLAALSSAANATNNLAIVCQDASQNGLRVEVSCPDVTGPPAYTQVYKTPTGAELVRVDPLKTVGQTSTWTNPNYKWKQFSALATGELYEVCTSDVAEGALVSANGCTSWAFFPKAAAITTASLTLSWTNPTAGCTNPAPAVCDNISLAGANALTAINIWISSSHIPDSTIASPTLTLTPSLATTLYQLVASVGSTVYVRARAQNAYGSSPLTDEVSQVITLAGAVPQAPVPQPPTGVSIKLQITN